MNNPEKPIETSADSAPQSRSLEDIFGKFNEKGGYQMGVTKLNGLPVDDPSRDYGYHVLAQNQINFFKALDGMGGILVNTDNHVKGLSRERRVNTPEVVEAIAKATNVQNEVLRATSAEHAIQIVEGYKLRGQSEMGLRERTDNTLPEEFYIDDKKVAQASPATIVMDKKAEDTQLPNTAYIPGLRVPGTPADARSQEEIDNEVRAKAAEALKKTGFAQDAVDKMYIAKAEALEKRDVQESKSSVDSGDNSIDFTSDDKKYTIVHTMTTAERNKDVRGGAEATPQVSQEVTQPVNATKSQETPVYLSSVDIDLTEMEREASGRNPSPEDSPEVVGVSTQVETTSPEAPVSPPRPPASEEEIKAKLDGFLDRRERFEKVDKMLMERRSGALGRLKRFGLKGLTGTLEGFGKLSPRSRLALGVGLAGASVLTGGALSAATFLVSSLSFASNVYKKNIEKLDKKSVGYLTEEQKHKAALRAAVFGTVLAAGSFFAFQELFKLADMAGEAISDKFNSVVDNFRSHFANSPAPSSTPLTTAPVAVPDVPQPAPLVEAPVVQAPSPDPVLAEAQSTAPPTPPAAVLPEGNLADQLMRQAVENAKVGANPNDAASNATLAAMEKMLPPK